MIRADIAIAPMGAVYFGDGRPTVAGETDHGGGRFPPSPRTIQGLVRTALLRSVAGLDLGPRADRARVAALVGPPEALPHGWQIAGPWPARWREDDDGTARQVEPWLPLPRFVFRAADDSPKPAHAIALGSDGRGAATMAWDTGGVEWACLAPQGGARPDADSSPCVSPEGLCALLAGRMPARHNVDWGGPSFVAAEPRAGIAVAPGKEVAEDSMLYSLGYRRFADGAGLVVRFEGELAGLLDPAALTRGRAALGGRSRLARLLAVEAWSAEFAAALNGAHLPREPAYGERFWLWLTTPAPLERPTAPTFVTGGADGARLSVLTAILGPPQAIGGFDVSRGASHGALRCLPPGSAWLVEVAGGDAEARRRLIEGLHDAFPFQLADPNLGPMGFGHTLLARAPDPGRR